VLYASDRSNSDRLAPNPKELAVVRAYFNGKTRSVAEKYSWRNSIAAYRWLHRQTGPPKL